MATARVVTDLGYGDAGKGALTDFLAHRHGCKLIVRVHGGAQAGHNVVTPTSQHHTFSQFGAASFQPDVHTLHAAGMVVAPLALAGEAAHLQQQGAGDVLARLHIDARCRVTTPLHQAANRVRENARGGARHGSCGIGFGETVRDGLVCGSEALHAGDLRAETLVASKLRSLRERLAADVAREIGRPVDVDTDDGWVLLHAPIDRMAQMLVAAVAAVDVCQPDRAAHLALQGDLLIEGAQGVLIDEWAGFHPHTTWSTCSTASANAFLAEIGWQGAVVRHGVLRTHMMRHGAGPLPGESAELGARLPERHNALHAWQGCVRKAPLDLVALRYALDVCGDIDELAVSHCDAVPLLPDQPWTVAWRCDRDPGDWMRQGQGRVVERLALPRPPDLDRQARLAELAFGCTAVAGGPVPPRSGDAEAALEWVRELAAALGKPVGLCGFGVQRGGWRGV